MRRKVVLCACVLSLVLTGLTSCQKIDEPRVVEAGPLVREMLESGDAIPLDYGELVGVTPDPASQWQVVLWFEAPDRSVTAVWVHTAKRRVMGSLKVPRR